ncbi:SMI1/KNR4 family protein (plasmid) [Limosilactobacillus reuteri]|uniref:SMI1/KNR4 family protein n=1 Tax=Limosilactobacillus reuteri TaxID=1598 RepID=A0A517D8G1_LIMRT|nr:SMI1/KNR4 family protein [Limosilactobacillus reuteri]QDR73642.1 SMI1/KNR4 family protein [Limosilactobacillus reuteri]
MGIDSIINSLKIMSQDSNYKIYVSGSLPINVGFRLKSKAEQDDLKKFDKIKYSLPNDYLTFISQINGAELFTDGKYIQKCKIYSIQETLHWREFLRNSGFYPDWNKLLPIVELQDIGQLILNLGRYESQEDYLLYPDEANKYFRISFTEWLNNYLLTNGSEFWYMNS